MRPIKFRGRRVDNGEYIYGDLLTGGNEFAIINDTLRAMVDPDSVAQLVGYDANGKEVYEGDTLIDDDGQEFVASLQGSVRWIPPDKSVCADMSDFLKTVPFDFAQQHTPLTLKEQCHD